MTTGADELGEDNTMQTVLIVCVILATAAVLAGTVYFVLAMIEIRKATKEIGSFAKNINMLAPLFNLVLLGGGMLTSITNKIKDILFKKTKGGKSK